MTINIIYLFKINMAEIYNPSDYAVVSCQDLTANFLNAIIKLDKEKTMFRNRQKTMN